MTEYKSITSVTGAVVKAVVAENNARLVTVVCSSETPDRAGDIVVQTGIDLRNYKRNPIVCFSHDMGKILGRCVSIDVIGGKLQAVVEFLAAGVSSLADLCWAQIQAGVLGAVSIGFIPKKSTPIPGSTGSRFTASELLELSFVAVPCQPDALVVSATTAKSAAELTQAQRQAEINFLQQKGRADEIAHLRLMGEIEERNARDADLQRLRAGSPIIRKMRGLGRCNWEG